LCRYDERLVWVCLVAGGCDVRYSLAQCKAGLLPRVIAAAENGQVGQTQIFQSPVNTGRPTKSGRIFAGGYDDGVGIGAQSELAYQRRQFIGGWQLAGVVGRSAPLGIRGRSGTRDVAACILLCRAYIDDLYVRLINNGGQLGRSKQRL